jgi:hypothetical protein
VRLVNQRDAVLDRADQRAQVAADAFGFIDDELTLAVDAGEDRLMRPGLSWVTWASRKTGPFRVV